MEKTICEMFAGVGGFRLAFDKLGSGWRTVWFNQWEPRSPKQWAHGCYIRHFGEARDLSGKITTGIDIADVNKNDIPDHTLLVGGFPCQDYSVAHCLNTEMGIQGGKGVLWWQIQDTISAKRPPYCLFENVDRLLRSPSTQRGRDFGIMLACLNKLGYSAEWRVVNAASYGAPQRRKRLYIFAYRNDTAYAAGREGALDGDILLRGGLFARAFPVKAVDDWSSCRLGGSITVTSRSFAFRFLNAGCMGNGKAFTAKVSEVCEAPTALRHIMEETSDGSLYLDAYQLGKMEYLKGAKKIPRVATNGHEYVYSEGAIAFPDDLGKPGRTMLTTETSLNRTSHVVRDPGSGRLRFLTPVEAERMQGFDDGWTEGMPRKMRYFCMGNALSVPMVTRIGRILDDILSEGA